MAEPTIAELRAQLDAANRKLAQMEQLGTNVTHQLDGKTLTLIVDLSQQGRKTENGNFTVATTHGNRLIAGTDCKIGLTVFRVGA